MLHEVHQGGFLPRRFAASRPPASPEQEHSLLHTPEDDGFDNAQLAAWVTQAIQLPGERL